MGIQLLILGALGLAVGLGIPEVDFDGETVPLSESGDSADDVAVWIHPDDPSESLLIGTDKKRGLAVFNLEGKLLHFYSDGKMNNVDIRGDIAAATNRTKNALSIYSIRTNDRSLVRVAEEASTIPVYGVCMYRSQVSGKIFAFVTGKGGEVQQWQVETDPAVTLKKIREWKLSSTTEGCVVDDDQGVLFISEEAVGVWKFAAEPTSSDAPGILIARVGTAELQGDVEGLAIYKVSPTEGWLIASSQGDNKFSVYRSSGQNEFIKSFRVKDTTHTDGIEAVHAPLGSRFPRGLFIAQDDNGETRQNFKLVSWERVEEVLGR